MRRNKHFEKEKEFIRLQNQLAKNWETQRNLGWEALNNPQFIGFEAVLEPRQDIQNRDDAWVFWFICQNFGKSKFSRKISEFIWNDKKKKHCALILQDKPHIESIHREVYLQLPEEIKKWFTNAYKYEDNGSWYRDFSNYYECKVPSFYFEIVYKKSYRTKVKLFSPILEQEEAEIKYILYTKFYHESRNYRRSRKAPKHFRKTLNKSQKSKSKQALFNIMNGKDCEFVDNYSGADWLWD